MKAKSLQTNMKMWIMVIAVVFMTNGCATVSTKENQMLCGSDCGVLCLAEISKGACDVSCQSEDGEKIKMPCCAEVPEPKVHNCSDAPCTWVCTNCIGMTESEGSDMAFCP